MTKSYFSSKTFKSSTAFGKSYGCFGLFKTMTKRPEKSKSFGIEIYLPTNKGGTCCFLEDGLNKANSPYVK